LPAWPVFLTGRYCYFLYFVKGILGRGGRFYEKKRFQEQTREFQRWLLFDAVDENKSQLFKKSESAGRQGGLGRAIGLGRKGAGNLASCKKNIIISKIYFGADPCEQLAPSSGASPGIPLVDSRRPLD
jgi:hypothetical protein